MKIYDLLGIKMFTFVCSYARVNYDLQIVAAKNCKQDQSPLILTVYFHRCCANINAEKGFTDKSEAMQEVLDN